MGLSPEELELQTTELLPARDVMQDIGGLTSLLDPVTGLTDSLGLGEVTSGATNPLANSSSVDGMTGATTDTGALGSMGMPDALGGTGATDQLGGMTDAVSGLVAT